MKRLTFFFSSLLSTYAFAAPDDLFLQAQPLTTSQDRFSALVSVDAINDHLDIFEIRDEGSQANGAGDYLGGNIALHYQLNPKASLEGSYWHRRADYAQDTNKIHSWLVGTRYLPEWRLAPSDQLALRASIWGNYADQLSKSTPTALFGQSVPKVEVNELNDLQFQLDAIYSHKLDAMNQLNGFASFGYSKVEVENLTTQLNFMGCPTNLTIQSNNQFSGVLGPGCGNFPIQGDASIFGLNMQEDLNHEATYASVGGSWNWRYDRFESQLAYQYQRLWRQDIDDRIKTSGASAVKDNHSIGIKLSYDFTPNLTGFIQGQYFKNNFIGTIPFLYNSFTASGLDRNYGYASIGLKLHSF